MLCAQCKNRNPVGNKFCRECGAPLAIPQDVLAAEESVRAESERRQEHVARLLTDAHTLADQHKFEQAILLAEEAAEQIPGSTSAHSLLAKLYEQVGATAKAMSAMEHIIALNPGSEADRATLNRLRNGASEGPSYRLSSPKMTPAMSRPTAAQSLWLPVAAAGIVGAFVLGVGLSVVNNRKVEYGANSGRTLPPSAAQTATTENTNSAIAGAPPRVSSPGMVIAPGSKINLPPPSDASEDPFASQNPVAPANTNVRAAVNRSSPNISVANSSLPLPNSLTRSSASRPFTLGPAPVKLIGVPTSSGKSSETDSSGSGGSFGQGGRITVAAPENASLPQAATTPTPQGDGYIRISVRSPRASDASATSGARSASSLDTSVGPLLRAQSQQSAGQYREAIGSYQMAVSADSGSAGEAYQGIALCYQRLGDTGSARAAYRNAIAGYESQIASGHAGGSAQRGIASCNAALEVLGG